MSSSRTECTALSRVQCRSFLLRCPVFAGMVLIIHELHKAADGLALVQKLHSGRDTQLTARCLLMSTTFVATGGARCSLGSRYGKVTP